MAKKFHDLTGTVYGNLTVLSFYGRKDSRKYWNCRCECGSVREYMQVSLDAGRSKSCGCKRMENMKKASLVALTKHGKTSGGNQRIYRIWSNMMTRCYNKNSDKFIWYGARGISVCERWHTFQLFLDDMGVPDESMTLDRIDNSGNYCKENCKWATKKEQANNTRANRIICVNGEQMTISQASEKFNINYKLLWGRLKNGWTVYRALGIENHEVS